MPFWQPKLNRQEKAYEMYLRTARLDLDDYNNDTEDGLHITSMAGTWMALVKGFGGMRVEEGMVRLWPFIPEKWTAFGFKVRFRGYLLEVRTEQEKVTVVNHSDRELRLMVFGKEYRVGPGARLDLPNP